MSINGARREMIIILTLFIIAIIGTYKTKTWGDALLTVVACLSVMILNYWSMG
jgi:hypothetical protein